VPLGATAIDRRRVLVTTPPEASLREALSRIATPRIRSPGALLHGIACAAAASPAAAQVPGAFVVRAGERPALAVIGEMDEAAEARVLALFEQINDMLIRVRYVDYAQAERDAEILAERLVARLGSALLGEATFVAIPRGGHIVLGMLVTALGVPSSRVGADVDPDRPVVVVDDCALSGNRFGRWIAESPKRRIVLACLYAHPDLAARVEMEEERVLACVAARDLQDRGAALMGAGPYREWRAKWTARLEPPRYWVGVPESLVFAWKEPDRTTVNRATGETELGWRVFPPQLCLSNRSVGAVAPVQVQPDAPGPIRPRDSVFFAEIDGGLVIADAEGGGAVRLDAVGAAMWHALVARGTLEAAAKDLEQEYDVQGRHIEEDLAALVGALTGGGYLEGHNGAHR
jgi:hypothetical protein